jgi:hypothetical protein
MWQNEVLNDERGFPRLIPRRFADRNTVEIFGRTTLYGLLGKVGLSVRRDKCHVYGTNAESVATALDITHTKDSLKVLSACVSRDQPKQARFGQKARSVPIDLHDAARVGNTNGISCRRAAGAGGTTGLGPTFQTKLSTSTLPSMR